MTIKKNKSGFTLLEIIIVVIIVGVLASLALPKLFSTVEFSRGTEAMAAIGTIRSSMERCQLRTGAYTNCTQFNGEGNQLDITQPGNQAGAHFSYALTAISPISYSITATRNTLDGGSSTATIVLTVGVNTITKGGTEAFVGF